MCMVQSLVESRFKEITASGGSIHSHDVNKEILAVVKRWESLQVMCSSVSPVFQVMHSFYHAPVYMYMYIHTPGSAFCKLLACNPKFLNIHKHIIYSVMDTFDLFWICSVYKLVL